MKIQFFGIYILAYWLLGILCFFAIFGYDFSVETFWNSPFEGMLSASVIFFSSLLASTFVYYFKKASLKVLPYPYFIFGCHVGNLSLFVLFIADALLRNLVTWTFPDFIYLFTGSFLELLLAWMFGLAFLAIIPSTTSALILYKIHSRWIAAHQ